MPTIPENRLDIPQNTILGRNDPGTGDWEVLSAKELARILFGYKALPSGRILSAAVNGSAPSATLGAIPADTLRAYPWDFDYPVFVNQITAVLTTAGAVGSQAMIALYTDTGVGYPAAKLPATELLMNGTVITAQSASFAALELYGRVWVVTNGNASLSARTIPATGLAIQGILTGLGNGSQITKLTTPLAFAAGLPLTFPAGAIVQANLPNVLVGLTAV